MLEIKIDRVSAVDSRFSSVRIVFCLEREKRKKKEIYRFSSTDSACSIRLSIMDDFPNGCECETICKSVGH